MGSLDTTLDAQDNRCNGGTHRHLSDSARFVRCAACRRSGDRWCESCAGHNRSGKGSGADAVFHNAGNRIRSPFPGAVREGRWSLVNGKELYDLEKDPAEQNDVASANPEVTTRLRTAYQKWFDEVAEQCGFRQPAIPVGHAEENPVWLPATRAKLNGGLKYFGMHGYAHDWATGWSSTASAEWEVDVVRDGVYQVQALYLSERAGIRARLVVQAGAKQTRKRR